MSPYFMSLILTIFLALCGQQISYGQQDVQDKTETFVVEKEYTHQGTTYQVGRLLLKNDIYGSLALRVSTGDTIREQEAPPVQYLEISDVQLIKLKGRSFFLVKGRYELFLIDLEKEKIAPPIRPGMDVNYREDAISGLMNGFQFFDEDQYLLGIAVSYGVFCFNISDLDHPKELLRYSSNFSDKGQPYFFLEKTADGSYNGIVSQSDTTKKSTHISGFYTETQKAKYLFQSAQLTVPEAPYADPADYEIGHPEPILLLRTIDAKGSESPWVVDLRNGELLTGKQATRF